VTQIHHPPARQPNFYKLRRQSCHNPPPLQIAQLYRQRADAGNDFDELKNQWDFSGACSQKAAVTQGSARIL
jgi:hypothetical protein